MTIKTIRAKSGDCQTEDVYRLLVLTHRMAGALAVEKIGDWRLSKTAKTTLIFFYYLSSSYFFFILLFSYR